MTPKSLFYRVIASALMQCPDMQMFGPYVNDVGELVHCEGLFSVCLNKEDGLDVDSKINVLKPMSFIGLEIDTLAKFCNCLEAEAREIDKEQQ
jgi:hypothetical protein